MQAAQPDDLLSRALLEQSVVYSLLEIYQPHIQPKIWGSSPWSRCSVTLPERESPCQSWLCCSGKLQVYEQRSSSQHSISEMNLWHNLSETLPLQPHGIPVRSTPSSLMTDIFLSWTMGKGCAGFQNFYLKNGNWFLCSMLVTRQSAPVSFGFGKEIRDGEVCNMFEPEGGKGSCILLVSQDRSACWNVDMVDFKVLSRGVNPKLAASGI